MTCSSRSGTAWCSRSLELLLPYVQTQRMEHLTQRCCTSCIPTQQRFDRLLEAPRPPSPPAGQPSRVTVASYGGRSSPFLRDHPDGADACPGP